MGQRGPAPKPTKLQRLEGNPGKRRINTREPEPTGTAVCPPHVTGAAAEEWARVLSAMPSGLYTAADVPVLTVYALAWVMYRNALALVARDGMIVKGSMGQDTAHPAVGVAAKQAEIIIRAADRLGMSPTARTRLQIEGEATKSKFAGLIGGQGSRPALRVVE